MKNSRVNEIDLLRFLAAIAVVLYHYAFRGYSSGNLTVMSYPSLAPVARYGYLGVELFFIISGFVILMTAANGSLRSFAVSRMVRLYPAYWACCTITFLVILAIGAPRFTASLKQYLVNMTMLNSFLRVPSIDGAYWSLAVEMRFYALVAVVLAIRKIAHAEKFLVAWLIISIGLETLPLPPQKILRFFLILEYSPYFIAGAAYFLIWSNGLSITRACVILGSWGLAIFQSIQGLPILERELNNKLNGYVVCAIISSFFVIMLLVSLRKTGSFGEKRWPIAGALTYPLYLLHQNIGYSIFNAAHSAASPHLILWGTLLLMLGLAYAVHTQVEKKTAKPMKDAINKLLDTAQQLLPGGGSGRLQK